MSPAEKLHAAAGKIEALIDLSSGLPWAVDSEHPHIVMKPDKPGHTWDGTAITSIQEDDFGLADTHDADLIVAATNAMPVLAKLLHHYASMAPLIALVDPDSLNPILAVADQVLGGGQ